MGIRKLVACLALYATIGGHATSVAAAPSPPPAPSTTSAASIPTTSSKSPPATATNSTSQSQPGYFANPIKNPSFEIGNTSPWTVVGPATVGFGSVAKEGVNYIVAVLAQGGHPSVAISQTVTGLQPGTKYVLEGSYQRLRSGASKKGPKCHVELTGGSFNKGYLEIAGFDRWYVLSSVVTTTRSGTADVGMQITCAEGLRETVNVGFDSFRMVPDDSHRSWKRFWGL